MRKDARRRQRRRGVTAPEYPALVQAVQRQHHPVVVTGQDGQFEFTVVRDHQVSGHGGVDRPFLPRGERSCYQLDVAHVAAELSRTKRQQVAERTARRHLEVPVRHRDATLAPRRWQLRELTVGSAHEAVGDALLGATRPAALQDTFDGETPDEVTENVAEHVVIMAPVKDVGNSRVERGDLRVERPTAVRSPFDSRRRGARDQVP